MTRPEEAAARWAGEAPLRVLVGPFVHEGHYGYMQGAFDDLDALSFGSGGGVDLPTPALASLDDILATLPAGWEPDLMLLWRPEYATLPGGLEEAPFPVAMLVSDWYAAFSDCVEAARFANVVVTGSVGERVFRQAGFADVMNLPMLGYQPGVDGAVRSPRRDIDVFSATNPNWIVHHRREHINARLLDLPPGVNLVLRENITRQQYNEFLGRSRIFVNQTVVGEINMKCYEVPNAGACLFVEQDNLDIRRWLEDGVSCVLYSPEDLDEKILYYLEHEEERAAIATAGQTAMQAMSYRANMAQIVDALRRRGRDELLRSGRNILRASPRLRHRHHAAHAIRHNDGDLGNLFALTEQLLPAEGAHDPLLWACAHYLANHLPEHRRPTGTRDMVDILKSVQRAAAMDPSDTTVLTARAALFGLHGDREMAKVALDELVAQLQGEGVVAFAGSHVLLLPTPVRHQYEGIAWRAVERGVSPAPELRALLLEHALILRGKHHVQHGEPAAAQADLEAAVAARPQGSFARPELARLQQAQGDWAGAARSWTAHLEVHPLNLEAWVGAVQCMVALDDHAAAHLALDRLQRLLTVTGNEAHLARVTALRAKLRPRRPQPAPADTGAAGAPAPVAALG